MTLPDTSLYRVTGSVSVTMSPYSFVYDTTLPIDALSTETLTVPDAPLSVIIVSRPFSFEATRSCMMKNATVTHMSVMMVVMMMSNADFLCASMCSFLQ